MKPNLKLVKTGFDLKQANLPDVYVQAVELIQKTIDLDEAKQWADRTEALVAWARMYNHDDVGVAAKRLRLHAFKRMGELARQLRPTKAVPGGGRTPGPLTLLQEAGLSLHNARAAVYLSKLTKAKARRIIDKDNPLSPQTYQRRSHKESSLAHFRNLQRSPFSCRSFLREVTPKEMADSLDDDEKVRAVKQMRVLVKWCNAFIRECK